MNAQFINIWYYIKNTICYADVYLHLCWIPSSFHFIVWTRWVSVSFGSLIYSLSLCLSFSPFLCLCLFHSYPLSLLPPSSSSLSSPLPLLIFCFLSSFVKILLAKHIIHSIQKVVRKDECTAFNPCLSFLIILSGKLLGISIKVYICFLKKYLWYPSSLWVQRYGIIFSLLTEREPVKYELIWIQT